ncbi:MAG: hypothetical protein U9Q81_26920 [Pseudomonadota bacterium]|nr:hypothetical protein [Pseudomonadota bacterium]
MCVRHLVERFVAEEDGDDQAPGLAGRALDQADGGISLRARRPHPRAVEGNRRLVAAGASAG